MKRKVTVILDCGHGLSKAGIFERPLCTVKKNGKVKIVNKFTLDDRDVDPDWYREDNAVLAIAREAEKFLVEMGFNVVVTRQDLRDIHQNVTEKYNLNQWKQDNWTESNYVKHLCNTEESDIYVSIHTNASASQKSNGVIGFWRYNKGLDLAGKIVEEIAKELKVNKRRKGLQKRKFQKFIGHSNGCSCLVECMFHTNANELKMLLDPKKIKKLGKAIAVGIQQYTKEKNL